MKESYFATQLKQNIADVQWTRIESSAGNGVPDVHVTWRGQEMWVELKIVHGRQIEIRASQINWLRIHLRHSMTNVRYLARDKSTILLLHPRIALGEPKRAVEGSSFFTIDSSAVLLSWSLTGIKPHAQRGFDWSAIRDGLFLPLENKPSTDEDRSDRI